MDLSKNWEKKYKNIQKNLNIGFKVAMINKFKYLYNKTKISIIEILELIISIIKIKNSLDDFKNRLDTAREVYWKTGQKKIYIP